MRWRLNQTYIEWGFFALLALLCAVLSILQYYWTGELSRVEASRFRATAKQQATQFCVDFDSALTKSCLSLVPDEGSVNDGNRQTIHLEQFQKWKLQNLPPFFRRITVAVPGPDGLQLFRQDQTTGKLATIQPPAEWNDLCENLSDAQRHGPPHNENPMGTLMVFPVMDANPGGKGPPDHGEPFSGSPPPIPPDDMGSPGRGPPFHRGPENEWVILELDTNYIFNVLLPKLARQNLNPARLPYYDFEVKTVGPPSILLYTSVSNDTPDTFGSMIIVRFNHQGRDPQNFPDNPFDSRWVLKVRSHMRPFESVIAAIRGRNLAIAIGLNAMIFIAGLALVQWNRRSRRLAEAQMNFVANVSHELRTPLTVIRGAGHNLLRGVARQPEQIEQYSKLIIQHADQLSGMVEQVLELAGARKNSSAALNEPVSLGEILNEAVQAMAHETEAAHCRVQLELPPSLPLVTGDASALRRVFQNLIANAAKHGGQGGDIGITAVRDEESPKPMLEIHVTDHGPGIPQEELPHIFKPFFRGAVAQATQIRGSGLGLTLVREIVEAHSGTISVQSEKDRGTIFIVRLPTVNHR